MGISLLSYKRRMTRHWDMVTSLYEQQINITNIIQFAVPLARLITSNLLGQSTAQEGSS
jgi:hypothetical protein